VPFLDALPEADVDDREFLTSLVLGYEVATRAGIAVGACVANATLELMQA